MAIRAARIDAPINFAIDVPIVITADLEDDTVTLSTGPDSIARDVAAALRRLADSIAPTPAPVDEHPAIAEARAGRRVAILLGDLQDAESALADMADVVSPHDATYRRVNGDHRLDFPSGGSVIAADPVAIRGRAVDTVVHHREQLTGDATLAVLGARRAALATAPAPHILAL